VKVMREGMAKDGHRLYPAMPYTSYTKLSLEDLSALYAYCMLGVSRFTVPIIRAIEFPARRRSFMAVWNAFYFKKGEYALIRIKT